jgi:hypothetical protein
MRLILTAALLAFPLAAHAQEAPAGTDVERLTLTPGQSASFTLAPGFDHQLLRHSAPDAKGAITIRYEVAGGRATVTAVSHTGYPTVFSVLADPDGDGGYTAAGEIRLAGDGTAASRSWPEPLGTINVGDFEGGPHGSEQHQPAGEKPAGS